LFKHKIVLIFRAAKWFFLEFINYLSTRLLFAVVEVTKVVIFQKSPNFLYMSLYIETLPENRKKATFPTWRKKKKPRKAR